MQAKGWITRRQDKKDKRTKRVYLTKKVQPTLQVMRDLAGVTRDEAVKSLSQEERSALMGMLRRMRDDLFVINSAESNPDNQREMSE
jgi:DNA-binding MarR family transcriptional regulator